MAYLYGASIQAIQEYIFATNQLKDIVGGSEIIKSLEEEFEKRVKNQGKIILNAAGNFKAVFDTKEQMKELVKDFPKYVIQNAYGITISQAIVKINNKEDITKDDHEKLDDNLKIQRNKPTIPLDLGISILELAPKSARALYEYGKNDEKLDVSTFQKQKKYTQWFNEKRKKNPLYKDIKDISKLSNDKNKVAVIHSDGNGLGKLIPKLKSKISSFSTKLDEATKQAFKDAAKGYESKIREAILGGDDLTLICDADIALDFIEKYLKNFEENTSKIEELKEIKELKDEKITKLTACAGIAFCNDKYPFHYAVSLAEELCSEAKDKSKRKKSCIIFHNIQSSNFQSWEKLEEDELTAYHKDKTIKFSFAPYYLDKAPKINDFRAIVSFYKQDNSPISKLRNWIGELHKNEAYANKLLNRINQISKNDDNWDIDDRMSKALKRVDSKLSSQNLLVKRDDSNYYTPIYDVLQILSVTKELIK